MMCYPDGSMKKGP